MRTKLGLYCDKVIEAGWLAAVIVVPLFFNIYSQRVFEPDKLSLLRSIALVMSVAWIIRTIEDWRAGPREEDTETEKPSFWQRVVRTPLVLPTLLLVVIYLISTVTSVVPRVSFLGSYQRLQGTYTTLSYIIIFFLVLQGLRTKRQLNRLINVMVLVSFPIAMYGLVQHFGLDPLPWGGDVTRRVASNMGNAIFVAAFLILVVPLTLSRLLENWGEVLDGLGRGNRVLAIALPLVFAMLVGFSWVLEIPFEPAKTQYFWLGLASSLIFLVAMVAFAFYLNKPVSRLLLLAAYAIILIVQAVCIFYTQSRGPLLGFAAGVAFYLAVLGVTKRRLWVTATVGALVALFAVGLFLFNTVESPMMDNLRKTPYVGRLGKLLQTESGTGKVRLLIWEGALDMISPHEPLEFPGEEGGDDGLNALRPVIGYGPESMYVAYNRFYRPDLAHFERRNASPDRSHNETFDALVITGGVGFVVYMLVFASVFYYGFKWLGLVRNRRDMWIFVVLWIVGGIGGALGAWAWLGPPYVGVGIPLGVMGGIAIYVVIQSVQANANRQGVGAAGGRYSLWILALLSAVVAHFVEIHFGIAIAATRTYFWMYAGMMVVIGIRLALQPDEDEAVMEAEVAPAEEGGLAKRRRRRRGTTAPAPQPRVVVASQWQGEILVLSVLAILILSTMLFDFVTIQQGNPGMLATLWRSLTQSREGTSLVMLVLFLITWGMIGLVGLGDLATRDESAGKDSSDWLMAVAIFVLISFGGALVFGLLHAIRLRPVTIDSPDAPNPLANTITYYYVAVFLLIFVLAWVLAFAFRRRFKAWRWNGELSDIALVASAVVLPIIAMVLIYASNISIVRADILYKQGLSSEKANQWDGAIYFYNKAVEVDKYQDFYYLFLGRAFMEKGKAAQGEEREQLLAGSREWLNQAREIAPLNTDHSANLARLHRTWGGLSQGEEREELLNKALTYYADATNLSPNNAQLLNEWGQTYYALGDVERAVEKYRESLALDDEYFQTYLLLGELYMREKDWDKAVDAYEKAAEIRPNSVDALNMLGVVLSQKGDLEGALEAYIEAVDLRPDNFTLRKNLALLYQEMGRIDDAIMQATIASDLAPENQKQSMEAYLAQLRGTQPGLSPEEIQQIDELAKEGRAHLDAGDWDAAEQTYLEVLELNANHLEARRALAYVYWKQGRLDDAIAENLVVVELTPDDWDAHKNLGILYQQAGEIPGAIVAFERALELAPEDQKPALQATLDQLKGQGGASPSEGELVSSTEPEQRAGDLPPAQRNGMYSAPPPLVIDPAKSYQATIVTPKGNIVMDLATASAPETVNNFVYLAKQGFYDNLTFHRVENNPGFSLIQGGDPTGTGTGGPGYKVPAEIGLPHEAGAIAMARQGDEVNPERASSGSQFYITLVPIPNLDGGYTVFGYVTEGLDVAQEIQVGDQILTIVITEE